MKPKTRAGKQQTQVRQEQIAQAALALVASQGLKSLSVAAVAGQVGLVPSAIYRHFRSKGEVLNAVLDLIRGRLLSNVEAVRSETEDALERIHRLLQRHLQLVVAYRAIPRILFSDEVYSGHPELKANLYGMIQGYLDQIGQIAREGQKQNRIRPDIPPETIAAMFMGLVAPSAFLWHLSGGRFNVARHAERAWKVFSAAIQGSKSWSGAGRRRRRSRPAAK
jgi:AcrR family transcriptional regulator